MPGNTGATCTGSGCQAICWPSRISRAPGPDEHLAEMQPYPGMRVVEHFLPPGLDPADRDAEFLVQFAAQRLRNGLAGLELAAGKLPVAGVDLARGRR